MASPFSRIKSISLLFHVPGLFINVNANEVNALHVHCVPTVNPNLYLDKNFINSSQIAVPWLKNISISKKGYLAKKDLAAKEICPCWMSMNFVLQS